MQDKQENRVDGRGVATTGILASGAGFLGADAYNTFGRHNRAKRAYDKVFNKEKGMKFAEKKYGKEYADKLRSKVNYVFTSFHEPELKRAGLGEALKAGRPQILPHTNGTASIVLPNEMKLNNGKTVGETVSKAKAIREGKDIIGRIAKHPGKVALATGGLAAVAKYLKEKRKADGGKKIK